MTYSISNKEITRRIWAYIRVSVSTITSAIITSVLFLFFITILSFRSLRDAKVVLKDEYFKREDMKKKEKIYYKDIQEIRTVVSTRKLIREIVIILFDKRMYILNGFKDTEDLYAKIKASCRKKVKIKQAHELLDYDHPLFYIILGLIIGVGVSFFVNFFINLKDSQINTLFLFFAGLNFILSFYFISRYPISKDMEEIQKSWI